MNGIQLREMWLSNALQLVDQQAKVIEDLQKQIAELQKEKELRSAPPTVTKN